jgi:hypothetical protein
MTENQRMVIAINGQCRRIMVAMPHRHGGVASMLVALGDANVEVIAIAPSGDDTGVYQLTLGEGSQGAAELLAGMGCSILWSQAPPPAQLVRCRTHQKAAATSTAASTTNSPASMPWNTQ